MNLSQDKIVLGVDIAKDWIDAFLLSDGQTWHVDNERCALEAWIKDLPQRPTLIVMEASGGYEATLATVCHDAALPVAVINPRKARQFAGAMGKLAKTDKIDACMLAEFGARLEPSAQCAPRPNQEQLGELTTRRRQYKTMQTMEKNRLAQARSKSARRGIAKHIAWLEREIERIERQLSGLIIAEPYWDERFKLMTSIKGVGDVTAVVLLSELPELGCLGRRSLAALAGLAPMANESGRRKGKRSIRGGRSAVRSALYMAALSARQFNPAIKALADRMKATGKKPKVILIACAHKLLRILNGVLRAGSPWQADWGVENT